MIVIIIVIIPFITSKDFECNFVEFFLETRNQSFVTCELKDVKYNGRETFYLNANHSEIQRIADINPTEEYMERIEDYVTQVKFVASKVSSIPNSIFRKFQQLRVLDVSNIELHNVNSLSLNGAEHLQMIFLYNNRLTTIKDHSFVHTKNLKLLDLSNNEILTIQRSAFSSLASLEELSLSNNRIKALEDSTFNNLINLQWIWLDRNKLTLISSDLFVKSNGKLRGIFLNNNKLSSISPYVFDNLESLRFLLLNGNSCVNEDFKDHTIQDNASVKFELRHCLKAYRNITSNGDEKYNITQALSQTRESAAACLNETLSFMSALHLVQNQISKLVKSPRN